MALRHTYTSKEIYIYVKRDLHVRHKYVCRSLWTYMQWVVFATQIISTTAITSPGPSSKVGAIASPGSSSKV